MIWPFNHGSFEVEAAQGALCSVSFARLEPLQHIVMFVQRSTLAALLRVFGSCRLMRELPSDETLMNSASMCLSTGSAFALSAEYCISSYKHLLWRVQGPFFSEHLFSQMILLLSPARSHRSRVRVGPPSLHLTALFSALVHLTVFWTNVFSV